jgi:hypothetical protein
MQLRKLFILTSVLPLLLVAPCAALAKPGGADRPLTGSGSSTERVNVVTGVASAEGTAHLSHLGKTTLTSNFVAVATGPTTRTAHGTTTFVAANGDTLTSTFDATGETNASGTEQEVTGVFAITGGTGRFAGATGTFTARLHEEVASISGTTATLNQTFTVEGKISY